MTEKKKKEDTIEVAKSGRAKCRACGDKIDKGALRFGLVDFGFSESGSHRWYHLGCAQQKVSDRLHATLKKEEEALADHRAAIDAELGGAPSVAADAADAAAKVLTKDDWPLWLTKVKVPKRQIPRWVRTAKHPTTKDGHVVDDEVRTLLVGAMMKDKANKPDKSLAHFREWLDPASYRRFAWALFRGWAHADAHMQQRWVVRHVAMVVDDDMAGPLGELIEVIDKKKKRDAVAEAVHALCAHGSPTALQVVQRIAQRYRYRRHNNPGLFALTREARKRGITLGELEDLSVPSCGLDARGTRRFSYGPRTFMLEVDDGMRLTVVAEDDGTRLPRLPKAWERDDLDMVSAAQAEFTRLKRDIEAMLPVQARRLEIALSAGRQWSLSGWTKAVRHHPLMQIIGRRLVWALYDGDVRRRTFRLDDADEIADENDDAYELKAHDGRVRIAHPGAMDTGEYSAWVTLFADYQIMAPFPQLARAPYDLTEEERVSATLESFTQKAVDIGPLHGRFNRGDWYKGEVDNHVRIRAFHKEFADGLIATAYLSPGFHPGGYEGAPQMVEYVDFRYTGDRPMLLKEAPPAAISEVIYQMNQLAG